MKIAAPLRRRATRPRADRRSIRRDYDHAPHVSDAHGGASLNAGEVVNLETWDAIRSRRNVRDYEDRPIAAGDLDRIAEAARRAPSSMNEQPWDFVFLTDRERLRTLAGVWRYAEHVAGSAATVALVAALPEDRDGRDWVLFDLGQACMSIMLAAADLGIASCHAAVDDQALARRVLGLPEDRTCVALVSLGYPVGKLLTPIERPDRRAFEDAVHREAW